MRTGRAAKGTGSRVMGKGMRPGCRGSDTHPNTGQKGARAHLAGPPVEGIFSLRRGGGQGFLTVPRAELGGQ